ncbi:polysaccharide biosynthesis/export family protein [uncultured Psychrobacter sp.]|uniref:polysaccharide biosynthesis/export family protein n=1 Tax=uncultured Psychrobacter sp. TaxID=259303 RepID=UPI003457F57A
MVYHRLLPIKQSPKLFTACLLSLSLLSGCTINSGLQAGDLPPTSGTFIAENGMQFNIQPLNLQTLPPKPVATPDSDLSRLLQQSGKADYRIAEGDILSITLIDYPDITPSTLSDSSNPYASGLPVDQQGFVQFPLIGRIKASGLSVPQFTAKLRSQLQEYLKFPDPQVKIINYRGSKFFIDGEVRQPGEFAIADTPVSLYSAISLAGGTTDTGDSNNIVLNRDGRTYSLGLQALQQAGVSGSQIYLRDGDSIHVNNESRNTVYTLGEFGVVEPIVIPEQGITLAQVLSRSRGLNSATADAAKVYIVRDNPGYPYTTIYHANLQSVTSLALANRFEMQSNDIIYVDPTGLARWNRIISALLPSTSAINSISRI